MGSEVKSSAFSGYVLLVLAVIFWAGNAIVGRAAAEQDIPPLAMNFWRWVMALAFFIPFFGKQTFDLWPEIRSHIKFILGFGLVSIVSFNSAFYTALQKTTALQASLIQSILPVLVLLLGLIILKTPITTRQWLGVVFSIMGALVIVVRGDLSVLQTLQIREGDWWALLAVFLWSIQAFVIRWKPQTIPIMPFMTVLSLVGVLIMAPLYALETISYKPMPFHEISISMIVYAGIIASVGGTTMWNEGTWRVGGAQAGYFGNLYPVFAGALAIFILGEQPKWYHGAGVILVLTGIWLAIFEKKPK